MIARIGLQKVGFWEVFESKDLEPVCLYRFVLMGKTASLKFEASISSIKIMEIC